ERPAVADHVVDVAGVHAPGRRARGAVRAVAVARVASVHPRVELLLEALRPVRVFRDAVVPVLSAYLLLAGVVLYAARHPDARRPTPSSRASRWSGSPRTRTRERSSNERRSHPSPFACSGSRGRPRISSFAIRTRWARSPTCGRERPWSSRTSWKPTSAVSAP